MNSPAPGTFEYRSEQREKRLSQYTRPSAPEPKKRLRKPRRHQFFLWVAVLLIFSGVCFGFFKFNQLKAANHFSHLKSISKFQYAGQRSGTFNLLLIGSDARKGETLSHTDSMVLIHADLNNHTYNLLSIPRDTRVQMAGYGYTKLTSIQYISQLHSGTKQGIIDAVTSISQLTGVPINFYAETNYWGLQDMVNSIGGITMNLPFNVTLTHPWFREDQNKTFSAGTHSLDGKMVAEITHERYSLPGTDYGRQQLQEAALIGISSKILKPQNITRLPALFRSMSEFLVATNIKNEDMVSIGLSVKGNFYPKSQIKYRQVQGQNVTMYDDLLKANNSEVILNTEQLRKVIQQYFSN